MKFELSFTKFQSTGNDFILIDARAPEMREKALSLSRSEIARICDRRFGVGGDGFILLLSREGYDFEMRNYNSDGGECTMCGNGARALVQFAHSIGIIREHYRFIAIDGEHEAKIENGQIQVKMKDVESAIPTPAGMTFDTGSPHLIRMVSDLTDFPVVEEGRKLRNSTLFMPAGINVNFVEKKDGQLFIRTYERGVEDETLSCGTGIIAAALAMGEHSGDVTFQARGGTLRVKFETQGTSFRNIWLIGPSARTFEGIIR
jgi:diaminopimelate epimerase